MSDEPPAKKLKEENKSIATKSGGAYIPPAKLRLLQQQITDKNSEEYQRLSWEALKKSINGLINKVNISNIKQIVRDLFQENLVRGRGVLARAIITAQNASPTFTHVYACFTAIVNARFPQNGELLLRRVIAQFRRAYRRNLKEICLHSVQFIAHLINQEVAHEIVGLQILTLLLEAATDDSVEVAVGFLKEAGQKLSEVSPRGVAAVFERLRHILHEQQLEKRVQYMIEVMFAIRKDGFKEHPAVIEDLDLVDESDQFTHMITLDDDNVKALETQLNVFRYDPEFQKREENYKQIVKEILDESSEGSTSGSDASGDESSENEEEDEAKTLEILDKTETNLVALRRTVYLAIQSSLSFEECAHKILKMEFGEQDYGEICAMVVDCCSQLRTYEKFFGLLGGRFCMLKKEFMENFEKLFAQQYETIHRLETNKLRNVAKFFAHLLHSDAIPWSVLSNIILSEERTTPSSRIFIKILFQEIVEYMGIEKLNQRLKDPTLAPFFEGIFPRDNPQNTRFAVNFFTSIGLGGVTDDLREHLKTTARALSQKIQEEQLAALVDASSSSSSDEDSSGSDSSSTEEESSKKRKSKKKKAKTRKSAKKHEKKKKVTSSSSDSEALSSDPDEDAFPIKIRSTITIVKDKKKASENDETEQKGPVRKEKPHRGEIETSSDDEVKRKMRQISSNDSNSSRRKENQEQSDRISTRKKDKLSKSLSGDDDDTKGYQRNNKTHDRSKRGRETGEVLSAVQDEEFHRSYENRDRQTKDRGDIFHEFPRSRHKNAETSRDHDTIGRDNASRQVVDESRRRNNEPRRVDEESRRREVESRWRDDDPRRRDDEPRKRDDEPRKRDDEPRKKNDEPRRRDDEPRRREDEPRRRDDEPKRRDDEPRRRDDEPKRRDDDSRRRDDESRRRDDDPRRRDDEQRRRGDEPRRGDESRRRDDEPKRRDNDSRRIDDEQRRRYDESRRRANEVMRDDEMRRRTSEQRNRDESRRRDDESSKIDYAPRRENNSHMRPPISSQRHGGHTDSDYDHQRRSDKHSKPDEFRAVSRRNETTRSDSKEYRNSKRHGRDEEHKTQIESSPALPKMYRDVEDESNSDSDGGKQRSQRYRAIYNNQREDFSKSKPAIQNRVSSEDSSSSESDSSVTSSNSEMNNDNSPSPLRNRRPTHYANDDHEASRKQQSERYRSSAVNSTKRQTEDTIRSSRQKKNQDNSRALSEKNRRERKKQPVSSSEDSSEDSSSESDSVPEPISPPPRGGKRSEFSENSKRANKAAQREMQSPSLSPPALYRDRYEEHRSDKKKDVERRRPQEDSTYISRRTRTEDNEVSARKSARILNPSSRASRKSVSSSDSSSDSSSGSSDVSDDSNGKTRGRRRYVPRSLRNRR